MRKAKTKNMFNLAFRFTLGVFIISTVSGMITVGIVAIFYVSGANFTKLSPVLIVMLSIAPCIIIGTAMAFIVGKRSLRNFNKVVNVVSEVGKGNFDVKITGIDRPENMKEIADNINAMARELKNLEFMRKDFIQNFSHEFKTPIVSIQGFTNRLLTKQLTEDEKREYLEIILEESTRLADLSTNTLYMSKLDSMERLGERQPFMLDEQLRRSVLLLEKQWQKKNIEMLVDDLPRLEYNGNEELLKQVWINLLSNAIKFTPDGGQVCVAAAEKENGVVVSITDSGVGMDDETAARVFDKYYQSDNSRATEGNGLGLSIVKKIVDLSGGTVSVKSKQGAGTTFTVTLPA